jgi:hypothetical protein
MVNLERYTKAIVDIEARNIFHQYNAYEASIDWPKPYYPRYDECRYLTPELTKEEIISRLHRKISQNILKSYTTYTKEMLDNISTIISFKRNNSIMITCGGHGLCVGDIVRPIEMISNLPDTFNGMYTVTSLSSYNTYVIVETQSLSVGKPKSKNDSLGNLVDPRFNAKYGPKRR